MRVAADHGIRIVEHGRRDERAVAPRRRRGVDVHVVAAREVVGQAVRRAERQAAVAGHVPRQPEARRDIEPLHVVRALPAGETRVARVEQAGRRVDEHLALDSLHEVVVLEDVRAAVEHLLAEVRFPARAVVEGDAIADAPRVLRVEPDVVHVHDEQVRHAVLEAADGADHQVRKTAARDGAVEHPAAARTRVRRL